MKDFSMVKAGGAITAAAWLGTPSALKLLMLLFFMEIVSSFFNPKVRLRLVIKQCVGSLLLTLMVWVGFSYVVSTTKINIGFDLVSGVCTWYGLGAAVEILLNFDAAGIGIPPVLTMFLRKAQGLTGKEQKALDSLDAMDAKQDPKP